MVPVEQLSNINFLNVYNIASEIKRELEITPDSKKYIAIRKHFIYSPENPSYPCFFNTRFQTIEYLKNIGKIVSYFDRGKEIRINIDSQDIFFLFCSDLGIIYKNRFTIPNADKLKIDSPTKEQNEDKEDDDEADCFSDDIEISTPYENTDLELFILKKILLEHKQRDDSGFCAKELSFNNNSLEEICRIINRLIEDKILYLSSNTFPERDEKKDIEGIETKQGFINWELVKKLDKNPEKMDSEKCFVLFDTYILDEIKLKARIDISLEEFMSDKLFDECGYLVEIPEEALNYIEQREIILNKIYRENKNEISLILNSFENPKVSPLKTTLALEKEGMLRIKSLDSNPAFENGKFVGNWLVKDNPSARIQLIPKHNDQQELKSQKNNSKTEKDKLKFYSETGDITFKEERGEIVNGSKGFALINFLYKSKNTIFTVDDIKEYCNSAVDNNNYKFRDEKDIDDTLRLIRSKLKVGKNAFFPIEKKGSKNNKKWIWIEK